MPVSGKNIREARIAARLSLKNVAELFGYKAPATTWQWENEGWKKNLGLPPPDNILEVINSHHQNALSVSHYSSEDTNEYDDVALVESDDEGVPSFGTWLRQEREAKKLSVSELSDRSKITIAQIHNIESGRTSNPQRATKDRLSQGLQEEIPLDVNQKTENQQRIEGLGSLVDFDPYSNLLPEHPGVYVLYDVSQRPVYVGKAKNISVRLKFHSDRFWYKRPVVEYGAYILVEKQELRHQLEQVLIKFLKSNAVLNKQSVDRESEE